MKNKVMEEHNIMEDII